MLSGLILPTSGSIKILDVDMKKDIFKIKEILNVSPQETAIAPNLTVKENLEFMAGVYQIKDKDKKINELIKMFKLDEVLNKRSKTLSGGWQRKVSIAISLINDPKILFLDEPTTGLDPQTRKLVWNVLNQLRKENHMTIFLTTHYMEEASDADYVIILDSGKIVAEGTPLQLKNQYTGDFITLYNIDQSDIEQLSLKYEKIRDAYRMEVSNTAEATRLIMQYPELFQDYEITKGKMDDVFLSITGKRLTGGDEK